METVVNEYRTCKESRGLSTDPKPTDWDNGSIYYEMDTGKVFMYDEEHGIWIEQNWGEQ